MPNTWTPCYLYQRQQAFKRLGIDLPKGKVKAGCVDQALSLIRSFFAVEKRAQHVTAEERLTLQATQNRLIIEKLEAWLTKSLNQVPPKTAIGKP
nr:transposase [Marinobacter sp.]